MLQNIKQKIMRLKMKQYKENDIRLSENNKEIVVIGE